MSNYHLADTHTQWFEDNYPGAVMRPNVVVLHTTEGTDWPSYSGGAIAPNDTAKPNMKMRRLDWRAHFPDERSSRALENVPGGVETNTLNAVQVELVGTCDPAHARTWGSLRAGVDYIYWPDAPDWALEGLADFLADQHKRHGLKLQAPVFRPYPASYGTNNGVRFTGRQWRNFYGVCGHQHVPENHHGDPGGLDIQKVLRMAAAIVGIKATAPEPHEGVDPAPSKPSKSGMSNRTKAAIAALAVFVASVGGWLATRHDDASPGAAPVKPEHVSVMVFPEKSFPPMAPSAYRSDYSKVLPRGGKRVVFLHTEVSGPAATAFKAVAKRLGLQTYGVRKAGDTAISTRGLERGRTTRIQFAAKPAGPASPARTFTLEAEDFKAGLVSFVAVHPPNGCNDKNRGKPWYAARCAALHQSITVLHKVVHYLVNHGIAVVIGGDMNQRKVITWDKHQSTATGPGLMQLAAIDSADVDLTLTRAKPLPLQLHTDHRVIRSELTVTRR